MKDYTTDELTVTFKHDDSSQSMIFTWMGQSTSQDPSDHLKPFFNEIIQEAEKSSNSIIFDFRTMEYMNSSTIAPIIYLINILQKKGIKLTIQYQTEMKWQELNFSTFSVFEANSGILTLIGE